MPIELKRINWDKPIVFREQVTRRNTGNGTVTWISHNGREPYVHVGYIPNDFKPYSWDNYGECSSSMMYDIMNRPISVGEQ